MPEETEIKHVEMPCLHCTILNTIGAWTQEFMDKAGEPPTIDMIGEALGAAVRTLSSQAAQEFGAETAAEFAQAFFLGQMRPQNDGTTRH